MEGSGEIIVDEKLKAIDKRTGRYINVIARTIDNGTSFPIVKYLDKNRKELNYDCVRHLNFDIDIDWELRRYQIVKDLLSNDFDGRRLSVDEVDNAIFTADLIINKGNYIPVYTSLSIIITNSHKLIGIEFVRNKERR